MPCTFAFLDVGNADAAVVSGDDASAVLIDVGEAAAVLDYIRSLPIQQLNAIYFTHEHRDHFPGLPNMVIFLENWIKVGTVGQVLLSHEIIPNILKRSSKNDQDYQRVRGAVERLIALEEKGSLRIAAVDSSAGLTNYGQLQVEVLWPSYLTGQWFRAQKPKAVNATSLVLRISYGRFRALFLADVDGEGLVSLAQRSERALSANIVKLPHHGAWPKKHTSLHRVLQSADPELAVLSVGSRNPHGHVRPELFALLNRQKSGPSKLLDFCCTEATKTCALSPRKAAAMGRRGLKEVRPCAGTVEIEAYTNGNWLRRRTADHEREIESLPYPACRAAT